MVDDPAVQSVRIAMALCDRFEELLKGPTQVRAVKQHGALFGMSGNEEALSLRIGEAQQVYPEIWRHLDEARAAFAARGIELGAYEQLRAAEGPALGADVNITHQVRGYGSHAVEEVVKSAYFNKAGLLRARQACGALMGATPQIDWVAIARAEKNDPAAAEFARAQRRKRWLRYGLLLLVIASPFIIVLYMQHRERAKHEARRDDGDAISAAPPQRLSEQERAALAAKVAQLRAELTAARKAWPEAVAPEALAKITPGARPCAFPFEGPPAGAVVDAYVRDGTADPKVFAASTFASYTAEQPVRDEALAQAEMVVGAIEGKLAAGTADTTDPGWLGTIAPAVVFLVVDREVRPELTKKDRKTTFIPGAVQGRAYVYSVRDAKIRCAAEIDARNVDPEAPGSYLDAVRSVRNQRGLLRRELEVRIRQAIAAGLRSTDPG